MSDYIKLILLYMSIPIIGVLVSYVCFLISCILRRLVAQDKEINNESNDL